MKTHSERKIQEWQGRHAQQRTIDRTHYPMAPSAGKGIIFNYKKLLKKAIRGKTQFKACVLGATPELRDMVLELGGNLTTIDISLEMILKCTPLMKYKNSSKETIIKGDWLDNPLQAHYFDVVLGDGVSTNIHFNDQDRFFKEIKRMLKPQGFFILRDVSINPDRKRYSIEEIDKAFRNGDIHWFDMLFNLYFYSPITNKCYDKETHMGYMEKLFREIEYAHQKKKLSTKAFEALWWFKGKLIHTFFIKQDFRKLINTYFQLLPVSQAKDYTFTQDTVLFYLGKNN